MANEAKTIQSRPLPLYEVVGNKKSTPTSKDGKYSATSAATKNTENMYAVITSKLPQTEKVTNVKRSNKSIVHWLAIFALVAVLVIVMVCILALFVNIAELRYSLQRQQNKKLNNSIEKTYQKLTEEYTTAIALLNNSMYRNTMNMTQELNQLSRDITSYGNKTDQLLPIWGWR